MNTKQFYGEVHRVEATLPTEPIFIFSLDNADIGTTSGAIYDASRRTAAICIVKRTHRLATEAEITSYREREVEKARVSAEIEHKKKQQYALPDEVVTLVRMAVASQDKRRG